MKRIVIATLALVAAAGAYAQYSGSYTFGGSTTVAPIAYAAIERFQKENPGLKISYEAVGSGGGLKALLAGQISLSGSSADFSADQLKGAVATPIALDGLSVIVNKKGTGIKNISMEDLARIYHGDVTNWKQLGGANAPIVVVNRDESSGTYAAFWELVCQKPFGKAIAYTKNAIVTKENGEVAVKVLATPGAIGYVGMAFAQEVIKAGGLELSIDKVMPTTANVVAKKYPISRYLYIVTKSQPVEGTVEKAFIDYILSPMGQAIVKSADYIPLPKK
ncbi:MAG: phosphate ABC transporter substrate-binding protein [Spirochaetes bacterium]|nr:phosphate ABC transporter substrate-binding protein [Spirochaetota bacterium]MBU1079157.1 phosphate ABC transporter substrate-binding protein [Spirochaetota bacterium]